MREPSNMASPPIARTLTRWRPVPMPPPITSGSFTASAARVAPRLAADHRDCMHAHLFGAERVTDCRHLVYDNAPGIFQERQKRRWIASGRLHECDLLLPYDVDIRKKPLVDIWPCGEGKAHAEWFAARERSAFAQFGAKALRASRKRKRGDEAHAAGIDGGRHVSRVGEPNQAAAEDWMANSEQLGNAGAKQLRPHREGPLFPAAEYSALSGGRISARSSRRSSLALLPASPRSPSRVRSRCSCSRRTPPSSSRRPRY
jgi:hypothetical protein